MYFDRARAIHGEYWHNNLGGRHSHGCVNVPVADGHWLYNWAPVGTWVSVFDPSGKTPTDEKYYLNDAGV
jgi:lipoprotein-anchoring transpeptidase ErfK/SrfK